MRLFFNAPGKWETSIKKDVSVNQLAVSINRTTDTTERTEGIGQRGYTKDGASSRKISVQLGKNGTEEATREWDSMLCFLYNASVYPSESMEELRKQEGLYGLGAGDTRCEQGIRPKSPGAKPGSSMSGWEIRATA